MSNVFEKLSKKDGEPYAVVITWLRTSLSFESLRSVYLSIRGSIMPFCNANEVLDDFGLNVNAAEVYFSFFDSWENGGIDWLFIIYTQAEFFLKTSIVLR